MKRLEVILTFWLSLTAMCAFSQMCPGGGLNFNSAVAFDPGWVYGCNTGTSCNGGVHFDNRLSCQPTTALDACAPAPTCSNSTQNSSNVWFSFYPSASSVTLSAFQNTSFVVGIQAFAGGSTCESLTQIGCSLAAGPSSGTNLTLNGLTVGQKYFFRIYGSAGPLSQRTGIYCLCGTSGVEATVLPEGLKSFTGTTVRENVLLKWQLTTEQSDLSFFVQSSNDGYIFYDVSAENSREGILSYSYTVRAASAGKWKYRLKIVSPNGPIKYSPILNLTVDADPSELNVRVNSKRQVVVELSRPTTLKVYNSIGKFVGGYTTSGSVRYIDMQHLPSGIYFMNDQRTGSSRKFLLP